MTGAPTYDLWPSAELAAQLSLLQCTPNGGSTTPECPSCGFAFDRMPQRKRACPGCKVAVYSRACPVRGKALWIEEELGALEAAWVLQAAGADLCRDEPAGELSAWIAEHFEDIARHEAAGSWGLARNGWLVIAGGCARRLLAALAAHALTGVIALDISGADNGTGFGAVLDEAYFDRELAELDGTAPPPLPCDPTMFERDAQKPYIWRPRTPVRDHGIGRVYPALLRALEVFCGAGGLDMAFVQQGLELHAAAMATRGAVMVPVDLAWLRFVVLAQQCQPPA